MSDGHDVIAVASRPAQRARGSPRYPDRRMRLLHGPWVQDYFLELPIFSPVTKSFIRPGLDYYFVRFIHPVPAFRSRYSVDSIVQIRVP